MNRNIPIAVLVLAIVAGGYIFWSQTRPVVSEPSAVSSQAVVEPEEQPIDEGTTEVSQEAPVVEEMILGDLDAPVTIIEYASYTCPHCRRFHEDVFPLLRANYIETGKVKFIMRDVYFDRFGLWASMVARCEGGSKFFGMVDLIFKRQQEWTSGDNEATVAASLKQLGKTAGMGGANIDACLNNAEMAQALVADYQANAERDQITSTPSFIINGASQANAPYSDFSRIIDGLLEE